MFLPGDPHGQRSLSGCSPWAYKESDRTEQLSMQHSGPIYSREIERWKSRVYSPDLVLNHLLAVVVESPLMSNSLWAPWLPLTRPPCPSPSPGVCPRSCSLHRWCRPAIFSSDTLFSFCPQSFPASGTVPMSHLFASDAIGWFDLLAIQGTFRSLLQHHSWKASILWGLPSLRSSSHNWMLPLGRPSLWLYGPVLAV